MSTGESTIASTTTNTASTAPATEAERFLEHFRAFGASPCPERYEALFDPVDGSVQHPGMPAPLPRSGVRDYMANVLATLPGFGFEIVAWAERRGTLFVEAVNRARPGGRPIEWGSVYRIVLRGDRVLRGQMFGDRVPILASLMPDATLGEIAGIGGVAPGLESAPGPAATSGAGAPRASIG